MHWCQDETMMVMSSIPFVGWYFRKFHAWYSKKFPKHKDTCHATGIDMEGPPDSIPPTLPFATTPDEQVHIPRYIKALEKEAPDLYKAGVGTLAYTDQGVFDLLEKWSFCGDADERKELEVEMLNSVADYQLTNPNVLTQEDLITTGCGCTSHGHSEGTHTHVEEPTPLPVPALTDDDDGCCHEGCCDDDH